jgi:hypothetical protein
MTLRPSIMIDAATRYCLEQSVSFEKPVTFLSASLLRCVKLPATFRYRKRRPKRLALPEKRQTTCPS